MTDEKELHRREIFRIKVVVGGAGLCRFDSLDNVTRKGIASSGSKNEDVNKKSSAYSEQPKVVSNHKCCDVIFCSTRV